MRSEPHGVSKGLSFTLSQHALRQACGCWSGYLPGRSSYMVLRLGFHPPTNDKRYFYRIGLGPGETFYFPERVKHG